jgi:hypothetical protein
VVARRRSRPHGRCCTSRSPRRRERSSKTHWHWHMHMHIDITQPEWSCQRAASVDGPLTDLRHATRAGSPFAAGHTSHAPTGDSAGAAPQEGQPHTVHIAAAPFSSGPSASRDCSQCATPLNLNARFLSRMRGTGTILATSCSFLSSRSEPHRRISLFAISIVRRRPLAAVTSSGHRPYEVTLPHCRQQPSNHHAA